MSRLAMQVIGRGVAVLEWFGLDVVSDYFEDNDGKCTPLYFIGWEGERAAGIRRGQLECSPTFKSADDAIQWAALHKDEIGNEVGE